MKKYLIMIANNCCKNDAYCNRSVTYTHMQNTKSYLSCKIHKVRLDFELFYFSAVREVELVCDICEYQLGHTNKFKNTCINDTHEY